MRQLLASLAGARGISPPPARQQIADLIADWFTDGAADRFNIMPPVLPGMLDVFRHQVIPLLQRRAVPHRLCGQDAARALRLGMAQECLPGGRAAGGIARLIVGAVRRMIPTAPPETNDCAAGRARGWRACRKFVARGCNIAG